jgi:hypothetical protein
MFWPLWPSTGNVYVENPGEEIKSTENCEEKRDLIFTKIVVIDEVILYSKHVGTVVIRVLSLFLVMLYTEFDKGV